MPDKTAVLDVLLAGEVIGELAQPSTRSRSFTYREGWEGIVTPLSLSMPLRRAPYSHTIVDPYLWGLIPDSHDRRRQLALQFDVSANNPMALLSKIGLDCAGAVRFCSPDATDSVLADEGTLVSLTEQDIAKRLRALITGSPAAQMTDGESWSLAGAQAKTAVRLESGIWHLAVGAQPTTHILKPGISLLEDQALNEYICMKAAEKIGLNVAKVSYLEFAGEPALCVERYDRLRTEDDRLIRVHQEDLCQALSVDPDNKYPADGGPTANAILDLLQKAGRAEMQDLNRKDFARALFFNYLVMAPDGHAKNYSLLLLADAVRLAPLYDIASGAPYTKNYGELRYKRMAMRIGGENQFGALSLSHLKRFAQRNGFDPEWTIGQFRQMAKMLPGVLEEAFDEAGERARVNPLRKAMLKPLTLHCKKAVL
jgi:serine/threonine-protein kinase HipA